MVNNYQITMKFTMLRIITLVALTSFIIPSFAQTTVEVPIGNPAGSSAKWPLGCYFGYERSIMVYDKTEINGGTGIPASSSITSLDFYLETPTNCPPGLDYNVKIYLKEVAPASLGTTTFPNAITGAQLVFDGTMLTSTWGAPGAWVSIALQNCFIFQTNANSVQVMVETNFGLPPSSDANGWFGGGQCGQANSIVFRASNTVNANFISWNQDNTPPTASGSPTTFGRPNIRFTYSPAVPCNALAPMTPNASAASVCSGVPFTVSLPTLPCVGGLSFQWQYNNVSTAGAWTNVGTGGTGSSLTITQSEQTSYRCYIMCANAPFNTLTTFAVVVNQNNYLACYCSSAANSTADTDIGNFTVTRTSNSAQIINQGSCTPTLNNGAATSTYTDYTTQPGSPYPLIQGEQYGLSMCQITQTGFFFPAYFNVWIDYNADGFFDPNNERVFSGGSTSSGVPGVNGPIIIPFSSDTGVTRLRVTLREQGTSSDPACGSFGWGEVEDYNVKINAGNICNLTTPGTATSSFPSVCANQQFTLNITGNNTVGSFQTWQWQISDDNGVIDPWSNITGATFIPYKTSQTTGHWYRCVLRCNGGATQNTASVQVPMSSPTACYCTPVHPANCNPEITSVSFNSLSNLNSGCASGNGPSYTQYPVSGSTTTSITQNSTYNLTITSGISAAIISVWIDWNRNGLFETFEWYQPSTSNAAGNPVTIPILVPDTSSPGLTGMRIRTRVSGAQNGAGDACLAFGSGEAEDYFITIVAFVPPDCNATPATAGKTVTSTQAAPCSNSNFTLTLQGLPVAIGNYTYQWQSSTIGAGGPYTNIPGATGQILSLNQTQTTWYQVVYGCSTAPPVVTSNNILVTNTPNYWKGVTSDWSNVANWCSGIPKITDDVKIDKAQPGVASPYNAPAIAVSDSVKARNLTIAVNDTITLYNDTLNYVDIAQGLTVNGKMLMSSSGNDICCFGTNNGVALNPTYQPFRTSVSENRLQMMFIQNDFASLPNLSSSDEVAYLVFTLAAAPASPIGTFQNLSVSYGWIDPTIIEYTNSNPFATPNTVTTIASLNLAGKLAGDTIMIPTNNFKWRPDSSLVLQICYNTPTGGNPVAGAPPYTIRVNNALGRRSALYAAVTSSAGGLDGCAITSASPGATSGFADARPNIQFIFGRKPKKLNIPVGGDLIINSTGTFRSSLANITVADSLNNLGTIQIDTSTITITSALVNNGTFDLSYPVGGTNEFSTLTVNGNGLTNTGNFIAGKASTVFNGTGITNSGTFNLGTSTVTLNGTNFTNNGTVTPGTGVLLMNGAAAQTIGGSNAFSLYRLRLAKGSITSGVVTLSNDALTVTDSINLITGCLDLNSKTLTFTNPVVTMLRPSSVPASGGYLIANAWDSRVKWTIGTNTTAHIFPFLKPAVPNVVTNYVPFDFANTAGAADNVGDITAGTYATVAANTPFPPPVWHINNSSGVQTSANTMDRFWYVERSTPAPGTGNSLLGFSFAVAERAPVAAIAPPASNATLSSNLRLQAYYTYTVASPPPLVRAKWELAPTGQSSAISVGSLPAPTTYRTQVAGYTWPTASGTSNPWVIGTIANPLPITLLQFDATLKGSATDPFVELNWATASEEQNDFFTIERTVDFNNIDLIDKVPSQGNSNMIQRYSTVDNDPVMGKVNYYRLLQTDIDGTTTGEDKWVPVNVGVKEVFNINYIKNLDKLEVMFEYDNTNNVDVVVTDMTGREMYRSSGFGATPGLNILPIDAQGWADGSYLITLRDKDRQVTHKIFY